MANLIESDLFFGRALTAVIWQLKGKDTKEALALLECLEQFIREDIKTNMEAFITSACVPYGLISNWSIIPFAPDTPRESSEAATSKAIDPSTPSLTAKLTPREADIVRLIVAGSTNKAIAATLGIHISTIKNTVNRIFTKLGVPNRAALVTYVLSNGL